MTVVDPSVRLHNLRPVGGVPTRDGAWVRGDRVWRSAAPLAARQGASDHVVSLGVSTVVDLRDDGERVRTPGAWQHRELDVRVVPVFSDRLAELRFDGLGELYGHMIGDFSGQVGEAFGVIAEHADRGVLMHCTAGKDRTGLLSALLLDVLGVDRERVLDDFARSQMMLGDDYLADLFADRDVETLPGIVAHRAVASPPALLGEVFQAIEHRHGGSVEFLRANGVTEAQLEALRRSLLTDP